jgi:hypothetical protein
MDALCLYHMAARPKERVETAQEIYRGRDGDGCAAFRGLAANWELLCGVDTTPWRDTAYWSFLTQTVTIIAGSAPERGWRLAWDKMAPQLRRLEPETDSFKIWADLNERLGILRGAVPSLPALRPVDQPGAGGADAASADRDQGGAEQGKEKGARKRGGGKPTLERSNPVKLQVYERIRREHQPGNQYADTVTRLKDDKDFADQVKQAGLKMNSKLVRAALAYFATREARESSNNQQTGSA